MNIRAEGKPAFEDWRKKVIQWLNDKNNILYKYFVFKFQNMVRSE